MARLGTLTETVLEASSRAVRIKLVALRCDGLNYFVTASTRQM